MKNDSIDGSSEIEHYPTSRRALQCHCADITAAAPAAAWANRVCLGVNIALPELEISRRRKRTDQSNAKHQKINFCRKQCMVFYICHYQ